VGGEGGVAGTVTDSAGAAVPGVPVELRDTAGNLVAIATTRDDGYYFVATGLASGDYSVIAKPSLLAPLAAVQFLGDASIVVAVSSPELRRDANLALPAAGGVQGVISPNDVPLAGVRVSLLDGGFSVASAISGEDGSYRISSVPPGSYSVKIDPRDAEGGSALGVLTLSVTVVAGQFATPVATFSASASSGTISGSVTDAVTGAGIPDVIVVIRNEATGLVSIANSDADGDYSSDALVPGNYKLQFLPAFSELDTTRRYVGTYYNGAATLDTASVVSLAVGQSVADIDAGLVVGGSIAGTVSGDEGGLEGVSVVAYAANGQVAALDISDAEGAYSLGGLPAGSYTVEFITAGAPLAATRAYNGAFYDTTPPTEPTVVAVAAGQAVGGIDQRLGRGVQLAGTITDEETGDGIPGVFVVAYDSVTGRPVTSAVTGDDGSYASGSLSSGSYKVEFTTVFSPIATTRTYIDEYFSNKRSFAEATAILIGRNIGVRTINAELRRGGSISGRVSAADSGEGLGGVVVVARRGGLIQGVVTTDPTGSYTVTGLPAGDHTVEFITETAPDPQVRRYVGELYNDVPLGGVGTPVLVVVQQDQPGVNAELSPAP
jgi:hypothetical protein